MGLTFSRMAKETRTKIAENSSRWFPSSEAAAEHEHKGRGLVSDNTHSGVPCFTLCPRSWGAHDKICSSLVKQKVKISVLGLIDAMSVLPVANFISVLFTVQTNYSS